MYDLLNWDGIREISHFWWEKGRGIFSLKGLHNSYFFQHISVLFFFPASQAQSWQEFLTLPQSHTLSRNTKRKHSFEINWKKWLPLQHSSGVACQGIQKAYKKIPNSSVGTLMLNKVKCSSGKGPSSNPVNTVLAGSWACSGLVVHSRPSPFSNLCLSS